MTPEAASAMKETTVGLTWSQLRAQSLFLRAHVLKMLKGGKKRA